MKILSFAKINLGLEIVGKRPDGFHDLNMITQSISLCDTLKILKIKSREIFLTCNENICDTKSNLAYKAAKLMFQIFNPKFGIKIEIDKKIPVGAGLGGGSSNAASVMLAVIKMLNLNLSNKEIIEISSKIGSDVPLCFFGGTLQCKGRGEIISKIKEPPKCKFLIKKGKDKISTPESYKKFDNLNQNKIQKERIDLLKKSINVEDLKSIDKNCFNDFELLTGVPDGWHLTGSGSAMFKILDDKTVIYTDENCVLCYPTNCGVKIIG